MFQIQFKSCSNINFSRFILFRFLLLLSRLLPSPILTKQLPPRPIQNPLIIPIQSRIIRRLHVIQTKLPPLIKIKYWLRIRLAARSAVVIRNPTPPLLLISDRFHGSKMNLLSNFGKFRHIAANKVAIRVPFLAECYVGVAAVELREECGAGESHPVSCVRRRFVCPPVSVSISTSYIFHLLEREYLRGNISILRSNNGFSSTSAPRSQLM